MTDAERTNQLETALALLIDYVEHVECYDAGGERVGRQVPAVQQARLVLGEEAWTRIMGSQ